MTQHTVAPRGVRVPVAFAAALALVVAAALPAVADEPDDAPADTYDGWELVEHDGDEQTFVAEEPDESDPDTFRFAYDADDGFELDPDGDAVELSAAQWGCVLDATVTQDAEHALTIDYDPDEEASSDFAIDTDADVDDCLIEDAPEDTYEDWQLVSHDGDERTFVAQEDGDDAGNGEGEEPASFRFAYGAEDGFELVSDDEGEEAEELSAGQWGCVLDATLAQDAEHALTIDYDPDEEASSDFAIDTDADVDDCLEDDGGDPPPGGDGAASPAVDTTAETTATVDETTATVDDDTDVEGGIATPGEVHSGAGGTAGGGPGVLLVVLLLTAATTLALRRHSAGHTV